MIMENLPLILNLQFLIFVLLIVLNFSNLRKYFGKIRKMTWFVLILFLLFAPILLLVNFIDICYFCLTIAKEFYSGGDYFVKKSVYGSFYSYLIYLSFSVFGINSANANYLELIFLVLNVFGVFLLSYFITKKESFSLIASGIYLLVTFTIIFYNIPRFLMNAIHFMLIFFLLFSLYSYKANNWKAYSLALVAVYFAGMIKFELMGLLYVFVIGLLIFRWSNFKNFKKFRNLLSKIGIPFVIFLIFSSVYLVYLDYSIHRFKSHRLSSADEVIYRGIFWTSIIYFSIDFVERSLRGLFYFLTYPLVFLFMIVSAAGLLLMIKKERRTAIYLIATFFVLMLPYISCVTCFQDRHFLYIIIPLLILSAYAIYELAKLSPFLKRFNPNVPKIRFRMSRKVFFAGVFLFLAFFSFIYSLPLSGNHSVFGILQEKPIHEGELYDISETINTLSGEGENQDVLVITSEFFFDEIQFFTLKKTLDLQDLIKLTEIYKKNLEKVNPRIEVIAGSSTLFFNESAMKDAESTRKMILRKTINEIQDEYRRGNDPLSVSSIEEAIVYFIETPVCNQYIDMGQSPCQLITANFNTNLLKEVNGYKLYVLAT